MKFTKLLKQSPTGEDEEDDIYQPKPVPIPPVKGWLLKVYRSLTRSFLLRNFLNDLTLSQGELDMFRYVRLKPKIYFTNKCEIVSSKVLRLKCSCLLFNSTCLKEEILPTYTNK